MSATEIVVADLGGTHIRFALATIAAGRVVALGTGTVLKVADYAGLEAAWAAFAAIIGRPLPRSAAIAVACPVDGNLLKLTNNPWTICPALLADQLRVDRLTLVNDFVAVGHAVATVGDDALIHLCGPDTPLAATGVISIVGPGTGLGVATLVRRADGYQVLATEGGHFDFAPLDPVEDAHVARLRTRFGRVSVERVVAGPGLSDWYQTLAALDKRAVPALDPPTLWAAALTGDDRIAVAALDRFCRSLGAVAGDIALVQGGFGGVVIAGGVGLRLTHHLPQSAFGAQFAAKGRFTTLMAAIPVRLLTHPQPGLFGAAAAFAHQYGAYERI